MPRKLRILFVAVLLIMIAPPFVWASATSNQTHSIGDGTLVTQLQNNKDNSAEEVELKFRLQMLESKFEDQRSASDRIFYLFAAFVTIFGVIPIGIQIFNQRRERGTQDMFLKGSADTIRLVNDTLGLAKDASERAATSAERRAIKELEDLDDLSQEIIVKSSQKDDRDIVSNPTNRTELEALAERIQSFDIYTVILDERVSLTPNCYFIRGIHAHLKQHFDEAIKLWKKCTIDEKATNHLKSLAYYWIGYENNNLGKFGEGAHNFGEAERLAEDGRKLELRRISLESSFFDVARSTCDSIMPSFLNLLCDAEARSEEYGISSYVDSIRSTAANVLYVRGTERVLKGETAADEDFQAALDIFARIQRPNKWSRLGHAQCSIRLDVNAEGAKKILRESVLPDARDEFVKRVEPRSKVLARLTELVCSLANNADMAVVESLRGQVLSSLGDVDNRLTLYSLRQRRNVSKDVFVDDLEAIIEDGTGT